MSHLFPTVVEFGLKQWVNCSKITPSHGKIDVLKSHRKNMFSTCFALQISVKKDRKTGYTTIPVLFRHIFLISSSITLRLSRYLRMMQHGYHRQLPGYLLVVRTQQEAQLPLRKQDISNAFLSIYSL